MQRLKNGKTAFCVMIILFSIKSTVISVSYTGLDGLRNVTVKLCTVALVSSLLFILAFSLKAGRTLLIAGYTLHITWVVVTRLYYSHFHDFLSYSIIKSSLSEGIFAARKYSWNVDDLFWVAFSFIDLLPVVFVLIRAEKIKLFISRVRLKKYFYIVSAMLLFTQEAYNYIHHVSAIDMVKRGEAFAVVGIYKYGTFGMFVINSFHEALYSSIPPFSGEYAKTALKDGEGRRSIVIIQVESLDESVINLADDDGYVAPFIRSLSKEYLYFPVCLCNQNMGTISAELTAINSSIIQSDSRLVYEYPISIARRLASSGYRSVAFHGNIGLFYHRDKIYQKMGFSSFYDLKRMGARSTAWGAADGDVLDFAFENISTGEKPFFAYLITMSSHNPYNHIPEKEVEGAAIRNMSRIGQRYKMSIRYADRMLETFCSRLLRDSPDTLIVIFGDHPSGVVSSDYTCHYFTEDGREYKSVPLLIVGRGIPKRACLNVKASFLDIGVTVLGLSGIGGEYLSMGQDLIDWQHLDKKIPYQDELIDRNIVAGSLK